MSGAQISRSEIGSSEHGSIILDIRWKNLFIEIVIYTERKQTGISLITKDTIPFTGHDEVFENNDFAGAIDYLEKIIKSNEHQ